MITILPRFVFMHLVASDDKIRRRNRAAVSLQTDRILAGASKCKSNASFGTKQQADCP